MSLGFLVALAATPILVAGILIVDCGGAYCEASHLYIDCDDCRFGSGHARRRGDCRIGRGGPVGPGGTHPQAYTPTIYYLTVVGLMGLISIHIISVGDPLAGL